MAQKPAEKGSIPEYDFEKIEKKWRAFWEKNRVYQPDLDRASKPFYNLMMFPYPSAEGMHVGGVYAFTGADTFARYKKMRGFDVFEPIGLDGFGIHSENYAMKIGQHIAEVSRRTEKNFYRQLSLVGNMYDWSRRVETYHPDYYRWTQWIFLKMFEKGLAYQKKAKVNWCPWCKTVLSDEQVIGGHCERCDSVVEKKQLKQWFFKITDYADRLLKNLDWIDWPEDVKQNQRNWIGKSEGALIRFPIRIISNHGGKNSQAKINQSSKKDYLEVFTTRPDTLFGATYMVIAPEHSLLVKASSSLENSPQVKQYVEKALKKSEEDRLSEKKQKTGIKLEGVVALNPATGEELPIFVADYVLEGYGTGAIMAVPAHDERDFEFAKKFNLPIKPVVMPEKNLKEIQTIGLKIEKKGEKAEFQFGRTAYAAAGVAVNSDFLNGLKTEEAKNKMMVWLEKNKLGKKQITYKLRDWCVSRQRYWGPPIPIVWCDHCALEKLRRKDSAGRTEKTKVLLVHGLGATGGSFWFPWMKRKLENLGCEVLVPEIGHERSPKLSVWTKKLSPYLEKIGENGVVIAHSLGSKAVLHAVEKMGQGKKIGQIFLVASAIGNPKRDWDWIKKKLKGVDVNVAALKSFWEEALDWKKIDRKIKEKFIIISTDDSLIDAENYQVAKLSNLEVKTWNYQRHFKQPYNQKLFHFIVGKMDKIRYPKNISLNFGDQKIWKSLLNGEKSVETRALNPEEKSRYFGKIAEGDRVIFRNTQNQEEKVFRILKTHKFEKLADFLGEKELLKKTFPGQKITTLKELENKYAALSSDGYARKIKENGLVAWEIELEREAVPVAEKDLPVKLPLMKDFLPEGRGKGPLAKNEKFVQTICPICRKEAERETDVSDPFVDSAWYFFRYLSNENKKIIFDPKRAKKWMPVDMYIGGKEHTVLHLLYSRFVTMFFKDLGLIDFEEPYRKFFSHGLITKDGAKMSKSKGNVVNPDEMLEKYGVDAVRLYLRFLGDFTLGGDWRDSGLAGMLRFVKRLWAIFFELEGIGNGKIKMNLLDKTVKSVGEDLEKLSFNTAVAKIMELVNWLKANQELFDQKQARRIKETLALLLAPLAPFLAEEFWSRLGYKKSIFLEKWPVYSEKNLLEEKILLAVQINGKLRSMVEVDRTWREEEVLAAVLNNEKIQKNLAGLTVRKTVYVPGRIVNLVV